MLRENIRLALIALKANKLRTFLTMLGIIIGLASIVTIMTIGNVMNNMVNSKMGDIGANNLYLYATMKRVDENGNELDENTMRDMKSTDYLSKEMMEDVLTRYRGRVEGISLSESLGNTKVKNGKKYANIRVTGVNPMAYKTTNLKLLAGNGFSSGDYNRGSKVCLVSDKYVNNMFDGDMNAALGQTVEAALSNKYYNYTIVGVYEFNARSAMTGSEKNMVTDCVVPLKTVMQQNPQLANRIGEITVVAAEGEDSTHLAAEIAKYVNEKYYKNNDAYEVAYYSLKQEAESLQKILNAVKYAFMAVGAISLLVGGIGVMNIMIVSIVERTREIGTRKALGATNGDIRMQFITESIVVCLVGGTIGVVIGLLLGQVVAFFLSTSGMPTVGGVAGCLLFSMGFGMFFGYYPANRAAKLNPIDALRYE